VSAWGEKLGKAKSAKAIRNVVANPRNGMRFMADLPSEVIVARIRLGMGIRASAMRSRIPKRLARAKGRCCIKRCQKYGYDLTENELLYFFGYWLTISN
jgi:hypothetical protein